MGSAPSYSVREPAPTAPDTPILSSVSVAPDASVSTYFGPAALPLSYISTRSQGVGSSSPASAYPAYTGQPARLSGSGHSLTSDAVLSFVTSYMGTHQSSLTRSQPAAPDALSGSARSGSGPVELHTDARLWEVQWPELSILRLIGHGSFGSVYLAEWHQIRVAVKVLVGKEDVNRGQLELPEQVLRDLQAEVAMMSRMRHPNVVQFMGVVAAPPALITEYCSRGSLYDCLTAAHDQPEAAAQLTWRRRLCMAIDAGAGLLYLHCRNIIHRGVKSPNLLVDEHLHVKVADFNLSKLLEGARPESSLTTGAATNPLWLAPEVLEGEKATKARDMYGFGMVLFELLTWRLPWSFAEMSPFKIGATIRQGGRPDVPPREALPGPDTAAWGGLDSYVCLMRECWAQQPQERPTFEEVVHRLRRLLEATPAS